MIKRWQEGLLREMLTVRRGVHLTGARQCGKSTLAEFVAGEEMRQLSLDVGAYLTAAKDDPATFVDRPDGHTLCIDEIQKVPELLQAIKVRIDKDPSPGQYLITGSSNLHFVKAVSDSLAGRLGRVRLRTLTLGEVSGGHGDFLRRAFARDLPQMFEKFDKRDVIHHAFCGGYPEPMTYNERMRRAWYREYLQDLLTKDVREVTEIRRLDALRKIVEWLLAYSSKFFEMKELGVVSGLSKDTLDNYIGTIKALYLFDGVLPWANSDYSKLGKRTKYYAADPGLMANLLNWSEDSAYYDSDISGKLVETWAYRELATLADCGMDYEITQYRDSDKREIDFLITNGNGDILGIEVKSGTVGTDDFKQLKWFAQKHARGKFTGIVLYSGRATLGFGDGFYAVPLAALGI